jgi:hypothetical protein
VHQQSKTKPAEFKLKTTKAATSVAAFFVTRWFVSSDVEYQFQQCAFITFEYMVVVVAPGSAGGFLLLNGAFIEQQSPGEAGGYLDKLSRWHCLLAKQYCEATRSLAQSGVLRPHQFFVGDRFACHGSVSREIYSLTHGLQSRGTLY